MKKIIIAIFVLMSAVSSFAAEGLPKDVLKKLKSYDVEWNTMSTTGSLESMPLGNGDITVNAWVEKGGDLVMYIGKSDCWAESTRLLKVGRVRVKINPDPFKDVVKYRQVLSLVDGEMVVNSERPDLKCSVKVRVDANSPVVHIDVLSNREIDVTCEREPMRANAFVLDGGDNPVADSFRGVVDCPVRPVESADISILNEKCVVWAHRNETSLYPLILESQGAGEFVEKYQDPYINRTFGAAIFGDNMVSDGKNTLTSVSSAKEFHIGIVALTEQTSSLDQWKDDILGKVDEASSVKMKSAYEAHTQWWREFWNRSWIFLSGDEDAEKATRAYLLQRYMMACQGRGAYPVKFNGGTLTFDYLGNDGDFRRWGPAYWHQNCRLYYWPLLASGDYDLLEPWFNMYMDMLPLQKDVTRKIYGHDGAYFPETLNFFGLFIPDDWGWNNKDGKASRTRWIRYHYSGALEMLAMMFERYQYTGDIGFARERIVPFATEVLRFFGEHWPLIDGKYSFIPANSLEQFWDCLNPVDYIAGMKYDLNLLGSLPNAIVPENLRQEWAEYEKRLPDVPVVDGKILPAYEYGEGRNFENPELYTIFPFRLYGLGLPDIDVARKTYNERVFNSPTCWAQDGIQAALLGNAEDAGKYLMMKVNAVDKDIRFPAFWRPGSDYVPDLDNGGCIALTMQYMLLNVVDGKRMLLPALPERWSADFKLREPGGKAVRVISREKEVVFLEEMN